MNWLDADAGPLGAYLGLAVLALAGAIARGVWQNRKAQKRYEAARQRFVIGRYGPPVMKWGGKIEARVTVSAVGGICVKAHHPAEAAEIVSQSDYFRPERRTA